MEGLYLFAKQLVDLKYPDGHEYREMFIAGLYGLLCKYNDYPKLIWTLFMQMDIFIEDKKIDEIITAHELDCEADSLSDSICIGVHTFNTDHHNNLYHILEKPVVACSKGENIMMTFNRWCHEVQHILKSVMNGYSIAEGTSYYSKATLRSGLSFFHYKYDKIRASLYVSSENNLLDEAINCIQTTEVIDEALTLKDFVQDEEMLEFLNHLSNYENNDYGYTLITPLVRQLWEIPQFKELVEKYTISGDILKIVNSFNEVMEDENSFKQVELLLDWIFNVDINMDYLMNYSENKQKFEDLVQKYKNKLSQVK